MAGNVQRDRHLLPELDAVLQETGDRARGLAASSPAAFGSAGAPPPGPARRSASRSLSRPGNSSPRTA